jgi:hypothetical protein
MTPSIAAAGATETDLPGASGANGVDHLEKREKMEIGVAAADARDSMLTHEDCGMRVMENISREVRDFCNDLSRDVGVALRRDENPEASRAHQGGNERPRLFDLQRRPQDPAVRHDAQEFIDDRPRREPGVGPAALTVEPIAAWFVKG